MMDGGGGGDGELRAAAAHKGGRYDAWVERDVRGTQYVDSECARRVSGTDFSLGMWLRWCTEQQEGGMREGITRDACGAQRTSNARVQNIFRYR